MVLFSPHPRAKRSTNLAAKIIHDAAMAAGAPKGIVACIENTTISRSQHLMQHPDVNLILVTGGPSIVHAAYSSGKPAIGVGAGNTSAIIDETAHIKQAVISILMSKTFDDGVICASEQAAVVVDSIYNKVKQELQARGAYILTSKEKQMISEKILVHGCGMKSDTVGQSAYRVAEIGGVSVPKEVKVLIAECKDISHDEPFAHEKLSPTLAMHCAKNFGCAVDHAVKLKALCPWHSQI